jgi:hypothetical protein
VLHLSNTPVAGWLFKLQGIVSLQMFLKQILISALVISAPMGMQKRQVDGLGIAEQVLSRVIDGLNAGGVTAGAKGVDIARGVIRQVRKGTGAGAATPIPPAPKAANAPPAEVPAPAPPAGGAEVGSTGLESVPSPVEETSPIPQSSGEVGNTANGQATNTAAKGGIGIAQGVLDRVQQGLGNAGVEAGAQGVEIAKQILAQVANGL